MNGRIESLAHMVRRVLATFSHPKLAAALLALMVVASASHSVARTYTIFDEDRIGFGDGQSREIRQTFTFPTFTRQHKLTFDWDLLADTDAWDRAGSIHAILPGGDQVQLGKFVTGFNGTTSHSRDISDLAPLLSGQTVEIEAHIDTWVYDAWRVNASVDVTGDLNAEPNPQWATTVISRDGGFGWWDEGDISKAATITVPADMENVKLTYFASGHHHEQTSASDEFNRRTHRLYVNGEEVWSGIPWRTDGPNFRDVNPTSGRTDGNHDGDYTPSTGGPLTIPAPDGCPATT